MKLKINICLFCLLNLFFQSGEAQNSEQLPKNLLQYYQLINKAEMSIVNGKSKEALQSYSEAFKYFPPGFPFDYKNAFLLALKLNDKDLSKSYAAYLIQHGICKEFFKFYPLAMDSINFNKFYSINSVLAKINYPYRDALKTLKDNQQRRLNNGSKMEDIVFQDSIDFQEFKKLIERYNFPSIENIGLKCSESKQGFDFIDYEQLVSNYCRRRYPEMIEILNNALINGHLKNTDYARYLSMNGRKGLPNYGSNPICLINEHYFESLTYDSLKEQIDKNRNDIGLVSYQDQLEEIKFSINNPYSYYIMPGGINIMHFTTEQISRFFKPFSIDIK